MSIILKDSPAVCKSGEPPGAFSNESNEKKGGGKFPALLLTPACGGGVGPAVISWGGGQEGAPGNILPCLGIEWQFIPVKCVWGWECGLEASGSWHADPVNRSVCARRWMELRMRAILISWLLWLAASSDKRVPHPFSRGRSHTLARTYTHSTKELPRAHRAC